MRRDGYKRSCGHYLFARLRKFGDRAHMNVAPINRAPKIGPLLIGPLLIGALLIVPPLIRRVLIGPPVN